MFKTATERKLLRQLITKEEKVGRLTKRGLRKSREIDRLRRELETQAKESTRLYIALQNGCRLLVDDERMSQMTADVDALDEVDRIQAERRREFLRQHDIAAHAYGRGGMSMATSAMGLVSRRTVKRGELSPTWSDDDGAQTYEDPPQLFTPRSLQTSLWGSPESLSFDIPIVFDPDMPPKDAALINEDWVYREEDHTRGEEAAPDDLKDHDL